jgi:predicted ribonuclease YlaK
MLKHWQHTEYVSKTEFEQFKKLNTPVVPSVEIPYNTAVYIQSDEGDRLEGVYDPTIKGIRKLRKSSAPNRDLRLYDDALHSEHITVLAVDGLMGAGKTSTLMKHEIETHLSSVRLPHNMEVIEFKPNPDIHKILIAKPAVNAGGEDYGFLPGDIKEKITPTLRNYTQYFDRYNQEGFDRLYLAGYVEILPLGFVRGMDAEDLDIIVDEAQNTKELVTIVSRKAKNARIFLLGDTSPFQIDLKGNTPTSNGLTHIIDLLQGASYFQYIEMKSLEHIVRSDEVRDLVRRLFKKHGTDPQKWVI